MATAVSAHRSARRDTHAIRRPLPPELSSRIDVSWGVEAAAFSDTELVIDRENKIIRNIKLIGNKASNLGRDIPQDVLERNKDKIAGAKSYWNHQKEAVRDNNESLGWFENIRSIPGKKGLYGDLNYLEHAKYTPNLLEIIDRNPSQMGMSVDWFFVEVDGNGRVIDRERAKTYRGPRSICEIVQVNSVDVVADPSATKSFQEATKMEETATALETGTDGMDSTAHLIEHCCKMVEEKLKGITDTDKLRKTSAKIEAMLDKLGDDLEEDKPAPKKKEEEKEEPTMDKESLRRLDLAETKAKTAEAKLAAREAADKKLIDDKDKATKAVQRCTEAAKSQQQPVWATPFFIGEMVESPESKWPAMIQDRMTTLSIRPGAVSHARENFEFPGGNPPPKPPADETPEQARARRASMAAELEKQALARA